MSFNKNASNSFPNILGLAYILIYLIVWKHFTVWALLLNDGRPARCFGIKVGLFGLSSHPQCNSAKIVNIGDGSSVTTLCNFLISIHNYIYNKHLLQ